MSELSNKRKALLVLILVTVLAVGLLTQLTAGWEPMKAGRPISGRFWK